MPDDAPRKTRLYGVFDGPPTVQDTAARASALTETPVGAKIARYEIEDVLGRGGMGEVLSATDAQIGRRVAVKRLRVVDPSDAVIARFLREARIQGRLEHPAVVPVHELWHEPGEPPFFVMKQLSGVTLGEALASLAQRLPGAAERYTTLRLLRAFADVCLALELAHTRGVVHRDLKPANIVIGDFGEVYVLDWGIARVLGSDDLERASFVDIDTVEGGDTVAGSILGTPGYISPEQIRGDADLDRRADVYALGCILFEMLALEPLHPRGHAALGTALVGVDARPSARAPDRAIPPELDAICVRATALDRDARFPTARELGDAVQRYLDGNRDLALRKQLAGDELAGARATLARGGPNARRDAMRAAARALALDPTDREPADLVGALMLLAPQEEPPEVAGELETIDLASLASSARFGTFVAIAYLLFFPLLYWIGFRDLWCLIAGPSIAAVIIFVEIWLAPRNAFWSGYIAITGNLMMFALFAWMVSPIVLGPAPATVMVAMLVGHRRLIRPWLIAPLTMFAIVTPWLWQLVHGELPVETAGSHIIIHTSAANLDPLATLVGLAAYLLALPALATVLSIAQSDEQLAGRRRLHVQSWQLRQLVPRVSGGYSVGSAPS